MQCLYDWGKYKAIQNHNENGFDMTLALLMVYYKNISKHTSGRLIEIWQDKINISVNV